jgi:hypothetical protein
MNSLRPCFSSPPPGWIFDQFILGPNKTIEGRVVHSLKDYSTKVVTLGLAFDEDGSDFWQVGFEF